MPKMPSRGTILRDALAVSIAALTCSLTGCQDGPLYALKSANPYFTMNLWKKQEEIGVTDHERREALIQLSESIETLPVTRQRFWASHLEKIMDNDENAEMRRLAVKTAGSLQDATAVPLIEKGLDDTSVKVRMEACRSLGKRSDEDAARSLASVAGTETNQDVRHAALVALANHKHPIAIDSLRLALKDRNPATRGLAIESLRGVTGKNYGDDPQVWIAALDGEPTQEAPVRFSERLQNLF